MVLRRGAFLALLLAAAPCHAFGGHTYLSFDLVPVNETGPTVLGATSTVLGDGIDLRFSDQPSGVVGSFSRVWLSRSLNKEFTVFLGQEVELIASLGPVDLYPLLAFGFTLSRSSIDGAGAPPFALFLGGGGRLLLGGGRRWFIDAAAETNPFVEPAFDLRAGFGIRYGSGWD